MRSFYIFGFALLLTLSAFARDLHVRLPKRSDSTPVQNYNRDGVSALQRHDYTKAKKLFYKAYLLDPNDPFTLNNLGYVAELEGDVDRAQRFYDLSEAMNSDAVVDKATSKEATGKEVTKVAGHFEQGPMQVNKLNLEAISFLIKGRPYEAEKILNAALKVDPQNPFTLNNLGYDMEQQGEMEKAIKFYNDSASRRSDEPIIVAVKKDWRGKGISEIAARNAQRVQTALAASNTPEAQVATLNLRGVSALNRNDHRAARQYFEQAFQMDNNNAFALNNMGYLAEIDGDRETAQLYYEKAKSAAQAERRVTVASDPHVEGKRLDSVASTSDKLVDQRMEAMRVERRRSGPGTGVTLADRGFSKIPPPEAITPTPQPEPEGPVPQTAPPVTNAPVANAPAVQQNSSAGSTPAQSNPAQTNQVPNQAQPRTPAPAQDIDPVQAPK